MREQEVYVQGRVHETSFTEGNVCASSCSCFSRPESSLQDKLKIIKSGSEAKLKPKLKILLGRGRGTVSESHEGTRQPLNALIKKVVVKTGM